METKKRFKMYKSGKKWLVAGIIAGGMATVGTVGNAHADEVKIDAPVQTEQVSSAAQPASEAASTSSSATAASSVASSSAVSSAASSSASSVASSAVSEASSSAASAASSSAKDVNIASVKTSTNDQKYSGTFGTADWYITNSGDLHIKGGNLDAKDEDNQLSWKTPAGEEAGENSRIIKNIYIDGILYLNSTESDFGDYSDAFSGLNNLENIYNPKNIKTDRAKHLNFSDNPKLKEIDTSSWDISNVTNLDRTFSGDTKLESIGKLNVTDKITSMTSMFDGDSNLSNLDVSDWDTTGVKNFAYAFSGTKNLKVIDISNWNVNSPVDVAYMFSGSGVEKLDFSNWNLDTNSDWKLDLETPDLNTIIIGEGIESDAITLPKDKSWVSSLDGKTYSSEEVMALYKDGKGQTATYTLASENNGTDTGKTDGNTDGKADGNKTDGNKTDGNTDGKTDGNKTDGNTDGNTDGKTDGNKTDGNKTDGNTDGKTDGNKTDGNTNGKTDGNKTDGNTNDKTDSNKTDGNTSDKTDSNKTDGKTNTNKSQSKDNQSKESTTGTDQKQESKKNTTVVAAKSNDNSSSNNGDVATTTVTNNASSSEKRQSPQFMKGFLPQTGENNTMASILTVVGVALAGLLASFGIAKKSRKH